jgi:triosephosphate isomerase
MRRPAIFGNWKMHTSLKEAVALAGEIRRNLGADPPAVDVGVCPPTAYLLDVADAIEGGGVFLGSQNVHWEPKGAFTGEVSADMLKDVGCTHCVIGHSERRRMKLGDSYLPGEPDDMLNRKVRGALAAGLTPIFCVGETLEERQNGQTEHIVRRQVEDGLKGIPAEALAKIILAYEPVWAIGTGRTATPDQAQEVHNFIRKLIGRIGNESAAQAVRIQYGGSVTPDKIVDLMNQPDVDGALVGGASLQADSFIKIVRYKA